MMCLCCVYVGRLGALCCVWMVYSLTEWFGTPIGTEADLVGSPPDRRTAALCVCDCGI